MRAFRNPDRFPVHRLRRVDRPTTLIRDHAVRTVDETSVPAPARPGRSATAAR